MQKPVALQSIVASQHLHAKIRYQRTLAFITNREAISVKLLHDVHSFLAPNTPRGPLSKVHPRGSLLEIHFQRFIPRGSLPDVHSQMFTHRCSLPGVHSQMFTPRCSLPDVHSQMFTSRGSLPWVHSQVFTPRC